MFSNITQPSGGKVTLAAKVSARISGGSERITDVLTSSNRNMPIHSWISSSRRVVTGRLLQPRPRRRPIRFVVAGVPIRVGEVRAEADDDGEEQHAQGGGAGDCVSSLAEREVIQKGCGGNRYEK